MASMRAVAWRSMPSSSMAASTIPPHGYGPKPNGSVPISPTAVPTAMSPPQPRDYGVFSRPPWFDQLTVDDRFVPEPARATSLYHIIGAVAELSAALRDTARPEISANPTS